MESIDSCLLVFKSKCRSAVLLEHGLCRRFYGYLRGMGAVKKYKFIIHLDENISVSAVKIYSFEKHTNILFMLKTLAFLQIFTPGYRYKHSKWCK